jgi:hypothetical protein
MPQRVYPVSYLIMICLILALSFVLVGNFVAEAPRFSHLSFFFLGAGFMLVETKGITEMGHLRQHLAGDRHCFCRHPDHGVSRQLFGAVA